MSNSQLNKLKLRIKSETEVTLNLLSYMIGNFKDDTNLNNSQISKLHKAFVNDSSTNIKLSKSQLHKTRH